MHHGFYTVAAATANVALCDPQQNVLHIASICQDAAEKGASLIVLNELCLTGYTAGDLFLQSTLIEKAKSALLTLAESISRTPIAAVVGSPIVFNGALYNCAAFLLRGKVLAIIPKTYIPNYGEFYEMRHFASGANLMGDEVIDIAGAKVPFGSVVLQDEKHSDLCIAVEICEDLWAPIAPSTMLCLEGATVAVNLSCSNEVVGKAQYRTLLVKGQSSRCVCAYVYADAYRGESTTDMVFSGHNIIAQNGVILSQTPSFGAGRIALADVDIERLSLERRRMTTYAQCQAIMRSSMGAKKPRTVFANLSMDDAGIAIGEGCNLAVDKGGDNPAMDKGEGNLDINKDVGNIDRDEAGSVAPSHIPLIPNPHPLLLAHPFVPDDEHIRGERCREVVTMQAEGLVQRLDAIYLRSSSPRLPRVVVGLSGGLDSTLALLVACKAFDLLNIPRGYITAITMPCFGTTSRTRSNAISLAHELGADLKEIDITQSVKSHLYDIRLSENDRSAAFENAQARERTQVLMDAANATGGIVLGTGDLSELALGWCTYNGDQMSMYGVNSSIPKTLVRHLVSYFASAAREEGRETLSVVLRDILATPVSPELLPPSDDGAPQSTEDAVGPYELHDFFLYYVVRFGFAPHKVLYLAKESHLPYSEEEIIKWMKVFYRRFFSQQFKRSAMPDGAKVGTVSLSPRGDWRMPSDASASLWLEEVDALENVCLKV